ncbi:MAG: MalY/PatB family protein [Brevinema sp.]
MKRMDFNIVYDRKGTVCSKWDFNKQLFGREDLLSVWVADMDLPCPPEVFEAIKKRMEHPLLGYTRYIPELLEQIVLKMKRDFDWVISPEWIVLNYDVVDALGWSVEAVASRGEEVLVQPPVYYPFFSLIRKKGCQVVENPLHFDGQRYTMDFDHMEYCFSQSSKFAGHTHNLKATILCNPHNPIGRVWSKDELLRYGEICLKNEVVIISDEIHCDLLYSGQKHYPIASLNKELENNTITCMSGGKTFNMGGMAISFSIIPNPKLRQATTRLSHAEPSVLSMYGLAAALKAGGEYYIKEIREHLEGNLNYMDEYLQKHIPSLKLIRPDATYLIWVDFSKLGFNREQLADFMVNKAKIAADYGFVFGSQGEGFVRFNISVPRPILEQMLSQLSSAIKNI